MSDFGAAVRRARRARGWTMEELAGKAGLHPVSVANIERGVREAMLTSAAALAKALLCRLSDFLPASRRPKPKQGLRATREAAGLALSAAAKRIGCGLRYLSEVERGRHEPSLGFIARVADAYLVDPGALAEACAKVAIIYLTNPCPTARFGQDKGSP